MTGTTPYHHPNLRQTLLDAAIVLIGEVGPRAFTLREVARRAGVSHNAPYRHFPSKDDLLAAVADQGFARLTTVMREAMEPAQSAMERLQLCGCGYVDFALRWPLHFQVMFDLPKSQPDGTNGAGAAESAFQVLLDCVGEAQQAGAIPPGDLMPHAWASWSLVHGIAKLAISGNLPLSPEDTLEFTRRACGGNLSSAQDACAPGRSMA